MSKEKNVLDSLSVNHKDANEIGDDHLSSAVKTPLRDDAFDLTDQEKIEQIQEKFADIMHILGLDLTDESLKGTPYRVAKMYVKEIFHGLNPDNKPDAKKFGNKYQYEDMVVVKNINVTSFCEHHFLPFIGKAHIAYFGNSQVIGLSKLNRIVDHYARRPQVQERLTLQIAEELQSALDSEDVAVFIESKHFCVSTRGIQDRESSTVTAEYRGRFKDEKTQQRFIDYFKTQTDMK